MYITEFFRDSTLIERDYLLFDDTTTGATQTTIDMTTLIPIVALMTTQPPSSTTNALPDSVFPSVSSR